MGGQACGQRHWSLASDTMSAHLSIAWALVLFTANGNCLVCEVCINFMANSCSGSFNVCGFSETSCITMLTETALGLEKTAVFEKACGKDEECSHPASMAAGNFRITTISRCCNWDHCNNGTIDWQLMNQTANGKTCPSCMAMNSQGCDQSQTITCTGHETECIRFTASKHRGSQVTLSGCATKSMSESRGKAAFPATKVTVTSFSDMNSGTGGAELTYMHPGLPALAGLLLLHLLLTAPS